MSTRAIMPSLVSVAVLLLGLIWNDLQSVKRDVTDVRERIARIEGSRAPALGRAPASMRARSAAVADAVTMRMIELGRGPR